MVLQCPQGVVNEDETEKAWPTVVELLPVELEKGAMKQHLLLMLQVQVF